MKLTRRRLIGAGTAAGAVAAAPPRALGRRRSAPVFTVEDGHLVARDARLEVVFDGRSGGVRSLVNRRTGQSLLADPGETAPLPWRLESRDLLEPVAGGSLELMPHGQRPPPPYDKPPADPTQVFAPGAFRYTITRNGRIARLRWETDQPGVTVHARVTLRDGDLKLWPRIANAETTSPAKLFTYPLLERVLDLSPEGAEDDLIYPQTSAGYLYRRPFEQGVPNASEVYPDGYTGNAMQVMGYFHAGVGGFSFAAHDPHATRKYLRFRDREVSFTHEAWDLRDGAEMDLGYPVVIAPMLRGDWYEVAEHYRPWALRQAWCEHGPNASRPDDNLARWAFETVGAVVWGMPSGYDWSPWFSYYSDVVGTPLHIVTGYDWSATRSWQKGFEGYFPANFHPNNVKAYKGHYVTPYMNDCFLSSQTEDFAEVWQPAALTPLRPPHQPFPLGAVIGAAAPVSARRTGGGPADPRMTADVLWFLCPTVPIVKRLHEWRSKTLLEQNPFLCGIQYDIGWSNIDEWGTCISAEHGHTPGAGRWINDHYLENARRSKQAMSAVLGRYASQGTECVNETTIAHVDHYVSRVTGGPQTQLEGRQFVTGEPFETPPGGGVELVPFFDAVYHDYAPVRHDGYAQLNREYGEIFYWVAARTVLQFGGLVSLDYNTRWPEAFPGYTGEPQAAMAPYDGTYYTARDLHAPDPEKGRFLRQLAKARVGFGNPWLAYGRLVRPAGARWSQETVSLDYANDGDHQPSQPPSEAGAWDVPRLHEAAWVDPRGRLGLFFVNLHEDEPLEISVDVNTLRQWGLRKRGARIVMRGAGGRARRLGRVGRRNRLRFQLTLAPRAVVLVHLTR